MALDRVRMRNRTGRSLTVAGLAITAGGLSMAGQAAAASPPAIPNFAAPTAVAGSVAPNAAIPDNTPAGLSSTITVTGAPAVLTDVDVTTSIAHTWTGDLDITLTSPQGTTVLLKGQTDSPLPDPAYQQGENDPGVVWDRNDVFNGTLWDDQAAKEATEVTYTDDVVEPALVPEGALGAFIGQNPNGVWTLKVVDTNAGDVGTLGSWRLDLRAQASLPASTTTTVSESPAAPVLDNATVTRTLTVAGAPAYLTDLNLTTVLPHTASSDLDVTLKSPKGTTVTVTTDNGKDDDNAFGTVGNPTVWDDGSLGSVPPALRRAAYGNVPVPRLTPEGAFAKFIGENPNGVWTLSVSDDAAGDTGSLASWKLDIAATAGGTVTPPATTPPGTTPPGTTPARVPPPAGTSGRSARFTLSAKQLLINQRIGQAAIRRLAVVEAKLDGKPVPTFSKNSGGKVMLSARQLLINQRIYQAGVRRAATLEARLAGRPAPVFTARAGGKVVLSVGQLKVNQRIAQAAVRRANALQKALPQR